MDEKSVTATPYEGTTTIDPGVLLTIARLTALAVPGVVRMADVPGGVDRIFRRSTADGVRIEVEDDSVAVDLYLVLANETNAREVSRAVQSEVARAVEDMVGMQVKRIDIHIEDIDFGEAAG
jgi:uncharacterized alkaline shock family protein YloU